MSIACLGDLERERSFLRLLLPRFLVEEVVLAVLEADLDFRSLDLLLLRARGERERERVLLRLGERERVLLLFLPDRLCDGERDLDLLFLLRLEGSGKDFPRPAPLVPAGGVPPRWIIDRPGDGVLVLVLDLEMLLLTEPAPESDGSLSDTITPLTIFPFFPSWVKRPGLTITDLGPNFWHNGET
jgi:hypothetical protein